MKSFKKGTGLIFLTSALLLIIGFTLFQNQYRQLNNNLPSCIGSKEQCQDKTDGTSCTIGVWCDKDGKICGGNSCEGMGLGVCSNKSCVTNKLSSDWKVYKNTRFGFSINFPSNFSTQNMMDKEMVSASSSTDSFYIYNIEDDNTYLEKYLSVEYSENRHRKQSAEKYLDIYHYPIPDESGYIAIYVSKDEDKIKISNEILSTFKFTDSEQISENKKIIQSIINHYYETSNKLYDKSKYKVEVIRVEDEFALGTAYLDLDRGNSVWAWIAKKIDGNWTNIWEGQDVPLCADIESYKVPKSIILCND